LPALLRHNDTVGRLGGDEFVVLVEGTSLDNGVEVVADRIRSALARPFLLTSPEERTVYTHVSIGIAMGVRDSADDLLRDADVALYEAKDAGKDCYVLFVAPMQTAVQDRLQLEMDLRDSVGTDEFFCVYQPCFDLEHVTITGVEALVRWQHPARGLVMPDAFIRAAELTGAIVPLGAWVLAQACRQAASWQRPGRPIALSVNVSASQLDTGAAFLDTIRSVLADTGLDPGLLTLEITETMLMQDAPTSAQQLHALKKAGCPHRHRRLRNRLFQPGLPATIPGRRLEDRPVVRPWDRGQPRIRHTDPHPGPARQGPGIETVAEGIEHQSQLELLQREGCDSGQGYLFARPLSLPDVEGFINLPGWVVNPA
jgi:predicted signal transduction protein with EAL and GGDEF domain